MGIFSSSTHMHIKCVCVCAGSEQVLSRKQLSLPVAQMSVRALVYHVFCFGVASGASVLLANDPSIIYTGRFNMENPLSPTYAWAATQISCAFTGILPKVGR